MLTLSWSSAVRSSIRITPYRVIHHPSSPDVAAECVMAGGDRTPDGKRWRRAGNWVKYRKLDDDDDGKETAWW